MVANGLCHWVFCQPLFSQFLLQLLLNMVRILRSENRLDINDGIFLGDYIALIVLRILMGLGEGTTFPALSVLLASWVPEKERSKLGSFVFGGGQVCPKFIFINDFISLLNNHFN